MKKNIKRFLSKLLPKGNVKEQIKCFYYNLTSRGATFGVLPGNPIRFTTKYKGLSFVTKDPLYAYAHEFDVYQKYYTVKPGDVIIDAGANTGYVSLLFSKLAGADGKVFAFEPDSINIAHINDNLALNENTANIFTDDLLLWNENTTIDFYESGTVGSSALWLPSIEKIVKKPTITIDDWTKRNKIGKVNFIKMNIEGAEIEAVEGSIETIKNSQPDFAIYSNHLVGGELTYIKLEAFFKKIGYPYKTVSKGLEIVTYAGPCVK